LARAHAHYRRAHYVDRQLVKPDRQSVYRWLNPPIARLLHKASAKKAVESSEGYGRQGSNGVVHDPYPQPLLDGDSDNQHLVKDGEEESGQGEEKKGKGVCDDFPPHFFKETSAH